MIDKTRVEKILEYLESKEDLIPILFLNLMMILILLRVLFMDLTETQKYYNNIELSIFLVGLMLFEKLKKIEKKFLHEGEKDEIDRYVENINEEY